ncbi:MAG: DUF2207 domain-containing protein [Candidatus Hydrothermarchaeales archaeon]
MSRNKFFTVFLFLVILVSVSPVYARDYNLKSATAEIVIDSNGIVHVTESITYTFSGTYKEVFRQIYPPPGGSIRNIKIECLGQPCESRVDTINGGYELVAELPQPTPAGIIFVVSYDYYKGLKVYDDISELHYKLWGEEWEKPLEEMEAIIYLPKGAGSELSYWLHPESFANYEKTDGDTIILKTDRIPSNTWYEIRVAFPRLENPNPQYVSIQSGSGLEKILEIEKAYKRQQGTANNLYILIWLLALIFLAVPFYIYYRFGREPEIDYHTIYEREPPDKSKPAAVNAIMRGRIGEPDMDAFVATIMDLVYRGYISLKDVKTEKKYLGLFNRTEEDIIIEINKKDTSELLDFEKGALNILKKHAKKGSLSWSQLKDTLGKDSKFYDFINHWNNLVEFHIKVEKLFISTGNNYLMAFGGTTIFLFVLGAVGIGKYFPLNQFPGISRVTPPGIIIALVGVGSLVISIVNEKGAGRFTPEGRLYYERWTHFRKYLTDFSALKEHPPESIKLWDFYMVYAVALGVAEKVIKNMALAVSKEEMRSSSFYALHYYPVFFIGFHGAYQTSNPSSSAGGVGGIGGGFGGGGGGAR